MANQSALLSELPSELQNDIRSFAGHILADEDFTIQLNSLESRVKVVKPNATIQEYLPPALQELINKRSGSEYRLRPHWNALKTGPWALDRDKFGEYFPLGCWTKRSNLEDLRALQAMGLSFESVVKELNVAKERRIHSPNIHQGRTRKNEIQPIDFKLVKLKFAAQDSVSDKENAGNADNTLLHSEQKPVATQNSLSYKPSKRHLKIRQKILKPSLRKAGEENQRQSLAVVEPSDLIGENHVNISTRSRKRRMKVMGSSSTPTKQCGQQYNSESYGGEDGIAPDVDERNSDSGDLDGENSDLEIHRHRRPSLPDCPSSPHAIELDGSSFDEGTFIKSNPVSMTLFDDQSKSELMNHNNHHNNHDNSTSSAPETFQAYGNLANHLTTGCDDDSFALQVDNDGMESQSPEPDRAVKKVKFCENGENAKPRAHISEGIEDENRKQPNEFALPTHLIPAADQVPAQDDSSSVVNEDSETIDDTLVIHALDLVRSGGMLSSTALTEFLKCFETSKIRVIDPSLVAVNASTSLASNHTLKIDITDLAFIIAPLCYCSHWTVGILDVEAKVLSHYDSLQLSDWDIRSYVMKNLFKDLISDKAIRNAITITSAACQRQTDSINCGVHVVANVLAHLTSKSPAPSVFDYNVWRAVFASVLARRVDYDGLTNAPPQNEQHIACLDFIKRHVKPTYIHLTSVAAEMAVRIKKIEEFDVPIWEKLVNDVETRECESAIMARADLRGVRRNLQCLKAKQEKAVTSRTGLEAILETVEHYVGIAADSGTFSNAAEDRKRRRMDLERQLEDIKNEENREAYLREF